MRRSVLRAAAVLTGAVGLVLVLSLAALLGIVFATGRQVDAWGVPLDQLSRGLTAAEGGYTFTEGTYLSAHDLWAILIGEDGQVLWQFEKPLDVPEQYGLSDVAAFSRWYLADYPVFTRIREDGLLVVGSAKESLWRLNFYLPLRIVRQLPLWIGGSLLLILGCVLAFSALLLRRWFRAEQRQRDAARSDWINGISHDIRTPLSIVMGYAVQLEEDDALPLARRRQAGIIRSQSEAIRTLVNDLNLTMRLDYEMQPLRRAEVMPGALLRQAAADLYNRGLEERYRLDIDLPDPPGPPLEGDVSLLSRALDNLLNNCVRHNPDGCAITLGARWRGSWCTLWVESRGTGAPARIPSPERPPADGGPPHGTGLKLVAQIARSHGGTARFSGGEGCFLCELRLPCAPEQRQDSRNRRLP